MKITDGKTTMQLSLNVLINLREQYQRLYVWKRYGKSLDHLTIEEKNAILKDMVLASVGELMEFLEKATNWKYHRPTHEIDRAKALEEYVDSFNYLLTPFIYMDITVEEFWAAFIKKHKVIGERFLTEFPDVIAQIDASLSGYRQEFREEVTDDGKP